MLSAIVLIALSTGTQAPDFFFKNKADSCAPAPVVVSTCTGCTGGCKGGEKAGIMSRLKDRDNGCSGCTGGDRGGLLKSHKKNGCNGS